MAASPLLLSSSRKPCLNAARSSPASAHARPPGVRGAGLRRERFYSCTAILPQSHANATHKNNTSVGAEAATAEAASFQHFCPWYCNTPEGGCKADPRRPSADARTLRRGQETTKGEPGSAGSSPWGVCGRRYRAVIRAQKTRPYRFGVCSTKPLEAPGSSSTGADA